MSVGHCMHHALSIGTKPLEQWIDLIAAVPEGCPHADCGAPRSCRERVADYLRVQWRAQQRAADRAEQTARWSA